MHTRQAGDTGVMARHQGPESSTTGTEQGNKVEKRRESGMDYRACSGTGEFTNKTHVITREVKGNTRRWCGNGGNRLIY